MTEAPFSHEIPLGQPHSSSRLQFPPTLQCRPIYIAAQKSFLRSISVFIIAWKPCALGGSGVTSNTTKLNSSWPLTQCPTIETSVIWNYCHLLHLTSPKSCQVNLESVLCPSGHQLDIGLHCVLTRLDHCDSSARLPPCCWPFSPSLNLSTASSIFPKSVSDHVRPLTVDHGPWDNVLPFPF